MYLFAGENTVIRGDKILGIFDSDTSTVSDVTKKMLKRAEADGRLKVISGEKLPKSYVLVCENGESVVYMSPISAGVLKKRLKKGL